MRLSPNRWFSRKAIAGFWLLAEVVASCGVAFPVRSQIATDHRPDITLDISGLASCADSRDHRLHLRSSEPVVVLVHGCFGSSGQFRGLAQVLAFQGQQSVCFQYQGRDRLMLSATRLRRAIGLLATQTQAPQVTVIGHSQGALIAHKSLTDVSPALPSARIDLRLVTISGPFGGITAARMCGKAWLYPLTLGLLPLSCYAVTGAKWADITESSQFIKEPGALVAQVSSFLKIDTDERGSCRRNKNGRCLEKDEVFSLAEQRNSTVETDRRAQRVEVHAGHVEIVGDKYVAPAKLIAILQERGTILPTAMDRVPAFNQLLARVYTGRREP
jgi:triacylglycerol esterase/lipase EstA (alpha/beta hydrolase family)